MIAILVVIAAALLLGASIVVLSRRWRLPKQRQPPVINAPREVDDLQRFFVCREYPDGKMVPLYSGAFGAKARRVYELAGFEAGTTVQFWDWDVRRGMK